MPQAGEAGAGEGEGADDGGCGGQIAGGFEQQQEHGALESEREGVCRRPASRERERPE